MTFPPVSSFKSIESYGWYCSVVLADRHRRALSLDQLIRVEIASRRGPERLSVAEAGDMVAIWASVTPPNTTNDLC
jgi:hypothetical protein